MRQNQFTMKQLILLVTFVALSSTTGIVNSASAPVKQVTAGSAPAEVINAFNNQVTDLMMNWFPSNPAYNAGAVSWTRVKGSWIAQGFVSQVGGNGAGLNIATGVFKNTGEMVSFNYTVVP